MMKQLTAPAAALALLMASGFSYADDGASDPLTVVDAELPSSRAVAAAGVGAPGDSARVSGSNDIYRVQIRNMTDAMSDARARDPIVVFGQAGYYLYGVDAWAMVSSGPIIGPYRSRSYSLFGSGFDHAALNRWTMRSEALRGDTSSDTDSSALWSHPGWRF
jgi:hypothetical protein